MTTDIESGSKWEWMLKAAIGIAVFGLPFVISMQVWLISEINLMARTQAVHQHRWEQFIASGPRYTAKDASADILRARKEILLEVSRNYPPAWLRERLAEIKQEQADTRRDMKALENEITAEFVRKNELRGN